VIFVTDLSMLSWRSQLPLMAETLRIQGIGLEILDAIAPRPEHPPMDGPAVNREARIHASLTEERFHRADEIRDQLRRQGARVIEPRIR
jgi:hypothetical protein